MHLIKLIKRRDRKNALPGISLQDKDLSDLLITHYNLTPREIEVANLILNGYSNKQIAELLSLALATVKTHIYRIFSKMNISSRTEMFVEIGQWTA